VIVERDDWSEVDEWVIKTYHTMDDENESNSDDSEEAEAEPAME
jgi:hypothetical protein